MAKQDQRKSKRQKTKHSSNATTGIPAPFFRLPAEIRNKIYLLTTPRNKTIIVGSTSELSESLRHRKRKRKIKRPIPVFSFTCVQIYKEMGFLLNEYFFARNTFKFGARPYDFELFRNALTEDNFTAIRSVRLPSLNTNDLRSVFQNFEWIDDLFIGPLSPSFIRSRTGEVTVPFLRRLCRKSGKEVKTIDRIWIEQARLDDEWWEGLSAQQQQSRINDSTAVLRLQNELNDLLQAEFESGSKSEAESEARRRNLRRQERDRRLQSKL